MTSSDTGGSIHQRVITFTLLGAHKQFPAIHEGLEICFDPFTQAASEDRAAAAQRAIGPSTSWTVGSRGASVKPGFWGGNQIRAHDFVRNLPVRASSDSKASSLQLYLGIDGLSIGQPLEVGLDKQLPSILSFMSPDQQPQLDPGDVHQHPLYPLLQNVGADSPYSAMHADMAKVYPRVNERGLAGRFTQLFEERYMNKEDYDVTKGGISLLDDGGSKMETVRRDWKSFWTEVFGTTTDLLLEREFHHMLQQLSSALVYGRCTPRQFIETAVKELQDVDSKIKARAENLLQSADDIHAKTTACRLVDTLVWNEHFPTKEGTSEMRHKFDALLTSLGVTEVGDIEALKESVLTNLAARCSTEDIADLHQPWLKKDRCRLRDAWFLTSPESSIPVALENVTRVQEVGGSSEAGSAADGVAASRFSALVTVVLPEGRDPGDIISTEHERS